MCLSLLAAGQPALAQTSSSAEERNLAELRNTVINLLQGLVEKGVLTREQAEKMVKDAQTKAQTEVAAQEAQKKEQAEAEKGAVRVPYVPEVVKEEIRKEVVAELAPSVKKEVAEEVTSKGSLASVLPDWVRNMTFTGDIRSRAEGDLFARDNAVGFYPDINQINTKGGREKAGPQALLNTTNDQERLRLRLRFGFDTVLGSGWTAGMRLATGDTGEVVATRNQTLGTYGADYVIAVDQAYLRWMGQAFSGRQIVTITSGRFENPWLSTDLVWYNDLTFEGVAANYRFNFSADNQHRYDAFTTVGAFPLSSISIFDPNPGLREKWLVGGQLGGDFHTENESRIRFAASYYDYFHIFGQLNDPESQTTNWTAPTFVQKGNTVFDISNTTDPTVNLYALASDFKIVDLIAVGDFHVFPHYSIGLTAEALKNIGFKSADVYARVGQYVAPRTRGYRADLAFGTSRQGVFGAWRASVGYRYLERDAVVDAFNDEDFHLGGTDTKGYTVVFDMSFNPRVWMRAKYMSANAIDGPTLGIDVWQLDLNARF